MAYKLEERDQWSKWVTPSGLKKKAIHDWLVFPHSFTDELVSALIEEWGLTAEDRILDPFVGAGTTILTAKQKGIPATGYDLSPFAVHVARSKIRDYDLQALKRSRVSLLKSIDPSKWDGASKEYPQLVKDALPGQLLGAFDSIRLSIDSLRSTQAEKDLFSLALLRTLPKYSRAVPTGGWLSWVNKHTSVVTLKESFSV
jgi:tRNA G10  N-methylase Trm11